MDEQAKEARRAYQREWRRRNRDKMKEYQARYWTRKAEKADSAQQKSAKNRKNKGGAET